MAFEFHDEGVAHLRRYGRAPLFDEPGLGKTRQLILAAEGRTLVMAPAMVLDGGVWDDEIALWRPDLNATQVSYSMSVERERTARGGNRPTDRLRPELRGHWDTIIFDEAHYLKGRDTYWAKAAERLSGDQVFLATGTPIPNWANELFMLLRQIFPEQARPGGRLGSYWRWAGQWFKTGPSRFSPMAVGDFLDDTPEGWARFHDENFEGRFLQRLRDDVLKDLPPLTEQWIKVPMRPEQKKVYDQLAKQFIAWVESTGFEITAWNKAALPIKLAKICTGLEVLDPSSRSSGKLDAMQELLANRAQPALVGAHFKDSARAAAVRAFDIGARVAVVDGDTSRPHRRAAVRDFQAGRLDVMCATLDVISEGLTLTRADMAIQIEHSWKPYKNIQFIRRIHRIGQTRPVTVVHLVTDRTVDIRIINRHRKKSAHQGKALRPREIASLV